MSSAEAPSAAVRTITPPFLTSSRLTMSRSRMRSSSSSRRETPRLSPLEVGLGDLFVLDHGDALLTDVDRDQELALRGRQRRAPWRRLAARGSLLARCWTALGPWLLLLLRLGLGFFDLGLRSCAGA